MDSTGKPLVLRALLDHGSDMTTISEKVARKLKLTISPYNVPVKGAISKEVTNSKGLVNLKLVSRKTRFEMNSIALIVKEVDSTLPVRSIQASDIQEFMNLPLADPNFHKPAKIDMLLGMDVYAATRRSGHIQGNSGLHAWRTSLGWVIGGPLSSSNSTGINLNHLTVCSELDKSLRRFWEIEEITSTLDAEDSCETFTNQTTTRLPTGQYQVRLPFIPIEPPKFHGSLAIAIRQFQQQEKRFYNNPELYAQYKEFMKEYAEMGHMKETTMVPENAYVIPHHAVVRPGSLTTKLRVVFNASQKDYHGASLNDVLKTGPKLQTEIFNQILSFRKYKVGLTADVEKMFRIISIHPDDQPYQMIVWRDDPKTPLKFFKLTTVTYGTRPAPFLANFILKKLAADEGEPWPDAQKALNNHFYVDDLLLSVPSCQEAQKVSSDLCALLKKGCFNLRKWASSHPEALNLIPQDHHDLSKLKTIEAEEISTLGIKWHMVQDVLTVQSPVFDDQEKITKRSILSGIAKTFDPLGWFTPVTVRGKILMQEIWSCRIGWDDPVTQALQETWSNLREDLMALGNTEIPRWVKIIPGKRFCLHGFADASEAAYGAVVYGCSQLEDGSWTTELLASKSKVAPVKKVTLPRLELMAAVLLARLLQKIQPLFEVEQNNIFAWSDSEIVLAWISKPSKSWKTFVANRVAEIQETTSPDQWNHVKSKENPADLVSRGTSSSNLHGLTLWWKGPHWLSLSENQWPSTRRPGNLTTAEEKAPIKVHCNAIQISNPFEHLSDFRKTRKVTAWVNRFIDNAREKENSSRNKQETLTHAELLKAEGTIWKLVQSQQFPAELALLQQGKTVSSSSKLKSLQPFLDQHGLLRIHGRLQHSSLDFNTKHPIILNSGHQLVEGYVHWLHQKTLHAGPQLLQAHLQQEFWILRCRNLTRRIVHSCPRCTRYRKLPQQPIMGDIPRIRLQAGKPFLRAGVDYSGPYYTRETKRHKKAKNYIVTYVCLATKAIHLELVPSLNLNHFIQSFRRFAARRGKCELIMSDNAPTFKSAKTILVGHLRKLHSQDTEGKMESLCKWEFIPPASPHFGGVWEAAVRSMKRHLRSVLHNTIPNRIEMETFMIEVEGILNSRPLTALSSEIDDLQPLSPNMLLTGESDQSFTINLPDEGPHHHRWRIIQQLKNNFWTRWCKEYLPTLQPRKKWTSSSENPILGQLGYLHEDNLPPQKWKLCRILECHSGKDHICRVVTIRTEDGTYKRPICKISLLPPDLATRPQDVLAKTRCSSLS